MNYYIGLLEGLEIYICACNLLQMGYWLSDCFASLLHHFDLIFQDKMGRSIMTLTRAILEGEFRESFPIDGTESGRLNLHLKWTPQTILRD